MKKTKTDTAYLIGGRHCGMTLVSLHIMEEALKSGQKQVVYVNFELPKIAKETLDKYATIKKVIV